MAATSTPMFDEFRSPGVMGILYAEDFDVGSPLPEPEQPPPPPLTQDDVMAACHDAVAAARAEWAHDAAERRALALQVLAAGLVAARRDAALEAEAVADALVRAALATLAGALPHLCRSHGPAEVSALLRQVLPALAARSRVVVRAHAALLPSLREDLAALPDGIADTVELRPGNLPPGDVRIAWEGGSLQRDTEHLCAAMMDGLTGLGLLGPAVDAAPERSLTHAE